MSLSQIRHTRSRFVLVSTCPGPANKSVGFTSTHDLRRRWYHPQLKIPAGERIARWALATQYGFERQIRWKPPMVEEMKVEDGRIVLRLDEAASAVDDGSPIVGFAVAGNDRRFHPAKQDRERRVHEAKALVEENRQK